MMHLVCYLRQGSDVFETYWTWMRGVEAMDNSYRLLDLTAYGRQEPWEDSPAGWPQDWSHETASTRFRIRWTSHLAVASPERRAFGRFERWREAQLRSYRRSSKDRIAEDIIRNCLTLEASTP